MNRIFIILYFLFSVAIANAQDTLVAQDPPPVSSVKYTEKDIQIDSETVEARHFDKNFRKKYKGKEFVYEFKEPEKSWWDNFKEWLARKLFNLFNFSSQ